MRHPVDRARVGRFMRELGAAASSETRLFFTGGVTAVLIGWRTSTVDIDIKLEPENDRLLRSIPRLKESLEINLELASPGDFIPELPGWRERCVPITREGRINFYHYDFAAQALAKIERGHVQDVGDVRELLARGLVSATDLLAFFGEIEPQLYRYPAIDPAAFRRAVERTAELPPNRGETGSTPAPDHEGTRTKA
jgi:hypothetical protein